mmetsp:Transcript_1985/g.7573  ORF Transcript_1985/g.7573 Transcript_1985/m.7573 type:complete len:644 (+) Transcript_1985:523-2454(+)
MRWVVALKSFTLAPVQEGAAHYEKMFAALEEDTAASWRDPSTPWQMLLDGGRRAASFGLLVGELEKLLTLSPTRLSNSAEPDCPCSPVRLLLRRTWRTGEGRDPRCWRPRGALAGNASALDWRCVLPSPAEGGAAGDCRAFEALARQGPLVVRVGGGRGGLGGADVGAVGAAALEEHLRSLQVAAFGGRCQAHPLVQMLQFGQAVRAAISPERRHDIWPRRGRMASSSFVPVGLCDGGGGGRGVGTHRRLGRAQMHVLAADLLPTVGGGAEELELLWLATSDDSCVMASTTIHDMSDKYLWVLTLPASHLVQWTCIVHFSEDGVEGGSVVSEASTVSFSGFSSTTSCRIPAHRRRSAGRRPKLLELRPLADGPAADAWRPEPLRLCPSPPRLVAVSGADAGSGAGAAAVRRPRRFVSACAVALHNASHVARLGPHIVEDWINYHLAIGVEHLTILDVDGSFEGVLRPFVEDGSVTYHGAFPHSVSPKLGLLSEGWPTALEPQMLEYCVWSQRHSSDWVLRLYNFEAGRRMRRSTCTRPTSSNWREASGCPRPCDGSCRPRPAWSLWSCFRLQLVATECPAQPPRSPCGPRGRARGSCRGSLGARSTRSRGSWTRGTWCRRPRTTSSRGPQASGSSHWRRRSCA